MNSKKEEIFQIIQNKMNFEFKHAGMPQNTSDAFLKAVRFGYDQGFQARDTIGYVDMVQEKAKYALLHEELLKAKELLDFYRKKSYEMETRSK